MSSSLRRAFTVIGLVFTVFFIAIFFTVRTAVRSYEPPADPAYHEKGMDYQKRSDEFILARERGWTATVNLLEAETIKSGANNLEIVLDRDPSKPAGVFEPTDRNAVLVTVSHPASLEGGKTFQFQASDFVRSGNTIRLSKEIDVPVKGVAEVSIELRPDVDSAIYISRKLTVE